MLAVHASRPGSANEPVRDRVPPRMRVSSPSMLTVGATLRTETANDFASLSLGRPLSVTRTVTVARIGPSAGDQVIRPVTGSMAIPTGAPASRLYRKTWPASGSVALAVRTRGPPSVTDTSPIGASTGGALMTIRVVAS